MLKLFNCVLLVSLAAGLAGCGGGGGKQVTTAPISGVVTLDGSPLAKATVNFVTDNFAGTATTDSEGKYTLIQGAEVGVNKIWFSKIDEGAAAKMGLTIDDDPEAGMDAGQLEAMGIDTGKQQLTPAESLPEAFSDAQKTEITYTVPEGGSETANFALTTP